MKYLLDTCTVSDFVKGEAGVLANLKSKDSANICISSLTKMEIHYGLALNRQRAKKLLPILDAFFSVVATLPFDDADAQAAGNIRAALKAKGTPLGPYDALIAGCALARGMTVVTSNMSEFRRINGLVIENWRNCAPHYV